MWNQKPRHNKSYRAGPPPTGSSLLTTCWNCIGCTPLSRQRRGSSLMPPTVGGHQPSPMTAEPNDSAPKEPNPTRLPQKPLEIVHGGPWGTLPDSSSGIMRLHI